MTERDAIALTGNLSRRRLLQGGALVGIGAFIAACRAGGAASPSAAASAAPTEAPSAGGSPAASGAASAAPLGGLNFANWTAYIDLTVTPGNDGVRHEDDGYSHPRRPSTSSPMRPDQVNYKGRSTRTRRSTTRTGRSVERRQAIGPGHHHGDRLDGRQDHPARLGRDDRPTGMTNFPTNLEQIYLDRSFDVEAR
jgi:hypothetical protein